MATVRCAVSGGAAAGIAFLAGAWLSTADAQQPIGIGWLGNSYICDNGAGIHLDQAVSRFINTAHDSGLTDFVVDTQAVSCLWAMGLASHAGDPVSIDIITSGAFTHVVLQGYIITTDSATMVNTAETNLQYVGPLADEVRLHGAVPIVWCAQPRCDATPEMWDYVIASYQKSADTSGSVFAPVSVAWRKALDEKPWLALYQGDCIHQNQFGIYLNAAMFSCVLTGSSVVGNPVRSVGPTIPDTTALYLQQTAWTVYDSVRTANPQSVRRASMPSMHAQQPRVSVTVTAAGVWFRTSGFGGATGVGLYALDGRRAGHSLPLRGR